MGKRLKHTSSHTRLIMSRFCEGGNLTYHILWFLLDLFDS